MTALEDFQFEIDGVVFGLGCPVFVEPDGFDPGQTTWRTQSQDAPRGGGRRFGRDLPAAPTWAWEMDTDESDPATALATLAALRKAWRATHLRDGWGKVTMLRYQLAGQTRVIFGRPENFAAAPDNKILTGLVPITADFDCADDLTYSDQEQATLLEITPSSDIGLEAPLTSPLTVVGVQPPQTGNIIVEGDEPTAAIVTFYGPTAGSASNFRLVVDEGAWEVGLDGSLAKDQNATVDPRPWATSVTRENGSSMAGDLSQETLMETMLLKPGPHTLRLTAMDPTGTATCKVAWRDASSSL